MNQEISPSPEAADDGELMREPGVGEYSAPKLTVITGRGYEIKINRTTRDGDLTTAQNAIALSAEQTKLLENASESQRDELVKGLIQGYVRMMETRRQAKR